MVRGGVWGKFILKDCGENLACQTVSEIILWLKQIVGVKYFMKFLGSYTRALRWILIITTMRMVIWINFCSLFISFLEFGRRVIWNMFWILFLNKIDDNAEKSFWEVRENLVAESKNVFWVFTVTIFTSSCSCSRILIEGCLLWIESILT